MSDATGLGLIGWILGAVTAAVIATAGVVVTVNLSQAADLPPAVAMSAIAR